MHSLQTLGLDALSWTLTILQWLVLSPKTSLNIRALQQFEMSRGPNIALFSFFSFFLDLKLDDGDKITLYYYIIIK
jgi:hypothetical protein